MSGTPWECRIVWPGETGEEVLTDSEQELLTWNFRVTQHFALRRSLKSLAFVVFHRQADDSGSGVQSEYYGLYGKSALPK
jgi:hypothetical protein